tara:strand:- start:443 stop:994 length:552 start_codon:yes stop_codon:yes gene_type:complete
MTGGHHKLLADFGGVPVIRRSALAAVGSGACTVLAVLGHRADALRAHLSDLDLEIIFNPDHATGLSSSLQTAALRVPPDAHGMIVHLADMPGIGSDSLRRLMIAFEDNGGEAIVRATDAGHPGHPVIFPRSFLPGLSSLVGDMGARDLIPASRLPLVDVELGLVASLDVDTPEALAAAVRILL